MPLESPEHITNCPQCSLWLPPNVLACPDCHTIVYGQYLQQLAETASQQEQASQWSVARDTWSRALTWIPPRHHAIPGR